MTETTAPTYAELDQRYREALAAQRIIAQQHDFTPAGDAAYLAAFEATTAAYRALCDAQWPGSTAENTNAAGS